MKQPRVKSQAKRCSGDIVVEQSRVKSQANRCPGDFVMKEPKRRTRADLTIDVMNYDRRMAGLCAGTVPEHTRPTRRLRRKTS